MDANGYHESYRKSFILGTIGAVVGGVLILLGTGSVFGAALGIVGGAVMGHLLGWMFRQKLSLQTLSTLDRRMNLFLGCVSVLLALGGTVGFVRTGRWLLLAASGFFAFCAFYLLAMTGDE